MRMPSARSRSFLSRAELRLQRLFAEVFDFACGDESVGHGFLLRLWTATIAALMTKTRQLVRTASARRGTERLRRSASLTPQPNRCRVNDQRTCGRWPAREGENLPQCEYARSNRGPRTKGRTRSVSARSSRPTTFTDIRVQARLRDTNGPDEGSPNSPREAERQRAP